MKLSDYISRNLGEMVVDRRGVGGVYDFELRWSNDDPNRVAATSAQPLPSSRRSRRRLACAYSRKVPVEMIVVDHVERVPTEN